MHDQRPVRHPSANARKAAIVMGMVLLTVVICLLAPAPKSGDETGVAMELPPQIGPLYAHSEAVTAAELAILPSDTSYARKSYGEVFSDPNDRILLSIVLSGKERRSIHRPERCLPAQGWSIQSSQGVEVPLASGRTLGATALLLGRPVPLSNGQTLNLRSYFLYWFVGENITTRYQFERILITNWDLLFRRVNQRWAYVIVSQYIMQDLHPGGRDPEQTLAGLKQFIHDSVPFYMKSEMPKP